MNNFDKLRTFIEIHPKLDHTDTKAVDALEMFILLLVDIAKDQISDEAKYFNPGTKTYKISSGYWFISCYDKNFEKNSISRHVSSSNYFYLVYGILMRLYLDSRELIIHDRNFYSAELNNLENEAVDRWLKYRKIAGAHTKYGQKPCNKTSRSILRYSVGGAFSLGYQFRDGYAIVGGVSDHKPNVEEEVLQSPIYLGKDWKQLELYIENVIERILN